MDDRQVDAPLRRDMLKGAAILCAAGLAGGAAVPMIRSMAPSADVESQRTVEVDLSKAVEGEPMVVEWQGRAVFILKRTAAQIEAAKAETTIEPEPDSERVQRPEWLILDATCQHLGCIPLWQPEGRRGWQCRCHGSEYDLSGRAIRPPTPKNLLVPPYKFLSDTRVILGVKG